MFWPTCLEDCVTVQVLLNFHPLKAIVTDVDGTLYRQDYLRLLMLSRLLTAHIAKPALGWKTLRVLRAYRKAQETLRVAVPRGDLAGAQIELTSERTGNSREFVRSCVDRWMEIEPLNLLAEAAYPGLLEFLTCASDRDLKLGVFSDYEATRKLEAMGISRFFQVVVSAMDPAVQQFKPGPRGLQVVLERLAVGASEALYVGDRPEVDAVAASRAGIRCVILGRSRGSQEGWAGVRTYKDLKKMIFG